MSNEPKRIDTSEPGSPRRGAFWGIALICAVVAGVVALWLAPWEDRTVDDYEMTQTATQPIQDADIISPSPEPFPAPRVVLVEPDSTLERPLPSVGGVDSAPITRLLVLVQPGATQYAGRDIEIRNVTVQELGEPGTFWVGPSNDERLFVVMEPGIDAEFAVGDTIDLVAAIERVPDEERMRTEWAMDDDELGELRQNSVYLRVRQAERSP